MNNDNNTQSSGTRQERENPTRVDTLSKNKTEK
jgi:hypothetical protein